VDGLIPSLGKYARLGPGGKRPLLGKGRTDVPRPGEHPHRGDPGPRVLEQQDKLLGQRLRLQHELHQAYRAHGPSHRLRHACQPDQRQLRSAQNRPAAGEDSGTRLRGEVEIKDEQERQVPRGSGVV